MGGAREGKRWLAAQGRPGRRFFLAAGLADLAGTAGTVILGWYIAALIVAGVVGTTTGHGLAGDVLGVTAGGLLRAAGGFAADRLAAAGGGRAEASARHAVLDALVLGDPADEQMSAGAAVAAVSEQLPRLGDHFHDYQCRAVTALPGAGRHPRGDLPGQLGGWGAARAGDTDRSDQYGGDRSRR